MPHTLVQHKRDVASVADQYTINKQLCFGSYFERADGTVGLVGGAISAVCVADRAVGDRPIVFAKVRLFISVTALLQRSQDCSISRSSILPPVVIPSACSMTSKHLLLLAIPCLAGAAGLFESGYVKQSDGGAYLHNAYPQVARLASGKMLVVWCVDPKDKRDPYVAAALSADGGKTWANRKFSSITRSSGMAIPTSSWTEDAFLSIPQHMILFCHASIIALLI